MRGAGARKLLGLMVSIAKVDSQSDQVCILYDEPESSLHADAQHILRTLLENLATKENVQVIYATHSPSMINSELIETFQVNEFRILMRVKARKWLPIK